MKRTVYKWMSMAVVLAFVVGCSGEETTSPPVVPTPEPNVNTDFDPAPPSSDTRLPDMSDSVPVALQDQSTYQGVRDIFEGLGLLLPLVGDSRIAFNFGWDADNSLAGNLRYQVEDQLGLLYTEIKSFLGSLDNNVLDVIFSDDELVVRVIGAVSGNTLTGAVYYRVREADEHQCKNVNVSCEVSVVDPGTWWWWGNYTPPTCDEEELEVDVLTPCRAYMNIGNSDVKGLGSFTHDNFTSTLQ